MDKDYILNDKEYEIFKQFSIKMTQNTKKDYLSKIILFKDITKSNDLLEITKNECKDFMEYVEQEYALSTCEKIFSYLHSYYAFMKREKHIKGKKGKKMF